MTALEPEYDTACVMPSSARRGPLGWVTPNSRVHWSLLALGVAGSVLFNLTYLIDGWLRPGYDWIRQPMSALSLGPGGAVQAINFVTFGVIGLVTASAWRASLGSGLGTRLTVGCGDSLDQSPVVGFLPGIVQARTRRRSGTSTGIGRQCRLPETAHRRPRIPPGACRPETPPRLPAFPGRRSPRCRTAAQAPRWGTRE